MKKARKSFNNKSSLQQSAPKQQSINEQINQLWPQIKNDLANIAQWKHLRELLTLTPTPEKYLEQIIACVNSEHMDASRLYPNTVKYIHGQLQENPEVLPPLLLALMKRTVIPNVFFETCINNIRRNTLVACLQDNFYKFNEEYIEAISMQCFLNEYAYPCITNELINISNILLNSIKRSLTLKILDKKTCYLLMLASCYFPLFDIFNHHPGLLEICEKSAFSPLILKIQVYNVLQEQKIKSEIESLSAIDDEISLAVREQYEKYPYPRWHSVEIIMPEHHVYNEINRHPDAKPIKLEGADVLIAGCGTGKHVMICQNPKFNMTAIDLSLSSLAYAIRNCLEYKINNVKFYQADILNLTNLKQTFDIIESCGVLHHTRSIDESFGELHKKLNPNGFFMLGLYSTTARGYLNNIRTIIKERGYKSELSDIRNLRETVMTQLHNDFNRSILGLNDFFTSSMLIDLLFHCNEITVDIPYIQNLIAKYNMKFITFLIDPRTPTYQKYREMFPEDKYCNNLDNWHIFEQANPNTFISMYQFILQKL